MSSSSRGLLAILGGLLLLGLPRAVAGAVIFGPIDLTAMQFDQIMPDVRGRALGGAVVAVPAAPADVWWNPAARSTGQVGRVQYVPVSRPFLGDLKTLAGAVEWRNLRVGLARTSLDFDIPGSNVFQPEGQGRYRARTWTINAGADLTSWIFPEHSRCDIAVGVNARRLSEQVDDVEGAVWDMDLGLIGSRDGDAGPAWWRLNAAAMVRNALGRDVDFEGRRFPLRHELRLGLAGQVGRPVGDGRRQPLQAMVAYGRTQNLDGDDFASRDHWGFELTLFELLSPRAGYATRGFPRFWSWGGGLRLAEPHWFPLGLTVDYARENWQELGGWQDQWAVGVSCELR